MRKGFSVISRNQFWLMKIFKGGTMPPPLPKAPVEIIASLNLHCVDILWDNTFGYGTIDIKRPFEV